MTPPRAAVVTARAAAEVEESASWWSRNRPSAPGAIREELERAFSLLSVQRDLGALARNGRLADVRRIHLSRVLHHPYDRVTPAAIEVLAFWHSNRGRGPAL